MYVTTDKIGVFAKPWTLGVHGFASVDAFGVDVDSVSRTEHSAI